MRSALKIYNLSTKDTSLGIIGKLFSSPWTKQYSALPFLRQKCAFKKCAETCFTETNNLWCVWDILHDIEVSDIKNQALDYRKVDVTLSERALGTTYDFLVGYMENISTACNFNNKLKYVFLKLNMDTKKQKVRRMRSPSSCRQQPFRIQNGQ